MKRNNTFKHDIRRPIIGFFISLALTLGAYITTMRFIEGEVTNLSSNKVTLIIGLFAISQLYIQLIFFLHLGTSRKSRLNLVSFLYTSIAILLVVIGTLWIMRNLEYGHEGHNIIDQEQINKGIAEDEIPSSAPKKHHDHQDVQ